MSVWLCVSASEEQTASMVAGGPRRDFLDLAAATRGRTLHATGMRGNGALGKLFGPHLRLAHEAAKKVASRDTVFADGEHIGLPFLALLWLRRKQDVRVVMLGHYIDRPWKKWLFKVATRLVRGGAVAVHSEVQRNLLRPFVHQSWQVKLVPYLVDTDFWRKS
jgi:hypothetical protein